MYTCREWLLDIRFGTFELYIIVRDHLVPWQYPMSVHVMSGYWISGYAKEIYYCKLVP